MRMPLTVPLFLLIPNTALADIADEHVAQVLQLSEEECRAQEQKYRLLYDGSEARAASTISFIAEGTRLICEAIRIDGERRRLEAEQARLRQEAERLERAWQAAHRANPEANPDFEGRDNSQQRLLSDATRIDETVGVLTNVHDDLIAEARRILNLSSAEFDLLSDKLSNEVLSSFDGEDEYDILIRLLRRVVVS